MLAGVKIWHRWDSYYSLAQRTREEAITTCGPKGGLQGAECDLERTQKDRAMRTRAGLGG